MNPMITPLAIIFLGVLYAFTGGQGQIGVHKMKRVICGVAITLGGIIGLLVRVTTGQVSQLFTDVFLVIIVITAPIAIGLHWELRPRKRS